MTSLKHIIRVVSEYRGVTPTQISSSDRAAHVARPRQEVCWLARRHTDLSFPAIARQIGQRDHTTIVAAVRVVAARAAGNPDYDVELDQLERLVQGGAAEIYGSVADIARRVLWSDDARVDSRRMAAGIAVAISVLDLPGLSDAEARQAALVALTRGEVAAHA